MKVRDLPYKRCEVEDVKKAFDEAIAKIRSAKSGEF